MNPSSLSLADGQRLLGMSDTELWSRYVALGGDGDIAQMRRHFTSEQCPSDYEHNIISQALNDAFLEQDRDHPVAYRHVNDAIPPR